MCARFYWPLSHRAKYPSSHSSTRGARALAMSCALVHRCDSKELSVQWSHGTPNTVTYGGCPAGLGSHQTRGRGAPGRGAGHLSVLQTDRQRVKYGACSLQHSRGSSRYATRERKEAKRRKASQAENAATAKSLPPAPNALSRRRSTSIIARNGDAERMLGNKGKAR